MVIFDSILAGKRIVISGDTKQNSIEEVQDIVMTLANMVSPPLYGISNLVHPYVHLTNNELLDDPSYIAGVINPMFNTKGFSMKYDIMIQIGFWNPNKRHTKADKKDESTAPRCTVLKNDDGSHPTYYDYKK